MKSTLNHGKEGLNSRLVIEALIFKATFEKQKNDNELSKRSLRSPSVSEAMGNAQRREAEEAEMEIGDEIEKQDMVMRILRKHLTSTLYSPGISVDEWVRSLVGLP